MHTAPGDAKEQQNYGKDDRRDCQAQSKAGTDCAVSGPASWTCGVLGAARTRLPRMVRKTRPVGECIVGCELGGDVWVEVLVCRWHNSQVLEHESRLHRHGVSCSARRQHGAEVHLDGLPASTPHCTGDSGRYPFRDSFGLCACTTLIHLGTTQAEEHSIINY